jgi:hypothetical protein
MKKLSPSLLLAATVGLFANSALAQGTMRFTWHGAQDLFQASFQIYDFEMVPGIYFMNTGLFNRTITVSSPDHVWPATPNIGVGNNEYGSRFVGGGYLALNVNLFDPSLPDVRVLMFGASGSDYQDSRL